jgi:hypothetical protein
LYFNHVIGQDAIKNHLQALADRDRLPHSLLFYGPQGLGKLDMALGLASYLLGRQVFSGPKGQKYLDHVEQTRLDRGESQKKVDEEGLPVYQDGGDAFWIRPTKKTLKVDQWYQLLRDHLNAASKGRRVVIVEDFHKANAIMANAMLKTIEEPPQGVTFIIITNTINTVLPTILSRCMDIPFGPVPDGVIRIALEGEGLAVTDQALAAGQGNPALVRQMASQGAVANLELALKLMRTLVEDKRAFALVALYTENLDRDQLVDLFHWIQVLSRDLMALRYGARDQDLQCPLQKASLLHILPAWPTRALEVLVHESLRAQQALRLYIKPTLAIDGLMLTVSQVLQED